jgi:Replication protein
MIEQSKETLLKRARVKFLSYNLANRLIESNPHSNLMRSYERSTYCNSVLLQLGQKLTGTYCKNRWCATCNRIRTAKLINGYEPALRQLHSPQFVTLTRKTVPGNMLLNSANEMGDVWRKILNSREGRKMSVKGVRKAECTERPNGHYHYHYHAIVSGQNEADWLVSRWLKQMGRLSDPKAQDIRVADQGSMIELFKYFTKLTKKGKRELIDFKRMDVIFRALKGKRVYQPFGGLHQVSEDIDDIESISYDCLDEAEQVWNWSADDWINDVGQCLTGYKPTQDDKSLIHIQDID